MRKINTLDVWTEPDENNMELFNGAFTDGWADGGQPFDSYKVVKHCNCEISSNAEDLVVGNKHNAIIFYLNGKPVRLAVAFEGTDIDACIEKALNQEVNGKKIRDLFTERGIKRTDIDLHETPIYNQYNNSGKREINIGSCDRPRLLNQMVQGSWTEDSNGQEESVGNFDLGNRIKVRYHLIVGDEEFDILHKGLFISKDKTQVIILQVGSRLGIVDFSEENTI